MRSHKLPIPPCRFLEYVGCIRQSPQRYELFFAGEVRPTFLAGETVLPALLLGCGLLEEGLGGGEESL
jgi:hypothetical protein